MATPIGVRGMGKGSEADDSLSMREAGAGARRHRRRSGESGSELGSHGFRLEQLLRFQAETIREDNPKENPKTWDCESNLYDSFELLTFLHRLNGALADASSPSPPVYFRSLSTPQHVGFRRAPAEDGRLPEVKAGRPDFQTVSDPLDRERRAKSRWSVGKLMRGLLKRSGGRWRL